MISCSTRLPTGTQLSGETRYAVLMMAYGGPDTLDEVEPFVMDVRGGRAASPELIAEIRERYELIGGRSPLREITCDQAAALEAQLNAPHDDGTHPPRCQVYVGMRHWYPYIQETVAEMVHAGVKRVVALCMTPYYSRMTVGAYVQKFREAMAAQCVELDVAYIKNWHTHPLFIEAVAEQARAALARFDAAARNDVQLLFTAHSLPASVVQEGDPYEEHLRETAALVVERLEMGAKATPPLAERWHFCYQSAGAKQVVWLGPSIDEMLPQLVEQGHKQFLIVPIGFLCDHVEILYDIDIELASMADEMGITLKRTDSLNVSPLLIDALADVVRQAVLSQQPV